MIQIPKQLNNQRFIFIRSDNSKAPIEKKWQVINNYDIDNNIFQEYLKSANIYGVPCGINNLVVLDFDDKAIQDKLLPLLPETFGVYSANKRLLHLYFYTDDTSWIKLNDTKTNKRILDIQGKGQYVIGPNSVLGNGKGYDIAFDKPIATLYRADLLILLHKIDLDYIEVDLLSKREKKQTEQEMDIFLNPTAQKIKKELKISQLLQRFNIPIHKNPTMCPLGHESVNGQCFSYNDETGQWHCFHGHTNNMPQSGDTIHLYQYLYGYNNFRETKNAMFKELFVKEQEYDQALKNINESVRSKTTPLIGNFEIDAIAHTLVNHFIFVTLKETDKIYYYDKGTGIYKPFGEQEIQCELEKYFTDLMKTHIVNEIINKIKRLTHKSVQTFNTYKDLICLKNGVFNFETKLLVPHSPDYYFLNSIPVIYNINAKCEKIDNFFKTTYEENPQLLYEICTFLLIKHNRHEKAIVLVGTGRNGKSVFLSLCKSFIGQENTSAKSLQNLADDRFATSGLFGKMANISADIPDRRIANSGTFKALVSGKDLTDAQFKGENSFQFVNTAKLLFSCNQLPQSTDNTDGYMRKWIILKFQKKFEGTSDNKFLLEEITDDEELSGLFNESVKLYDRINNIGFNYTENVDEIREMYCDLSDPLQRFLDSQTTYDGISGIPFDDFYNRYNEWLQEHKINILTKTALGLQLKRKNIKKRLAMVFTGEKRTSQSEIFGYSWLEEEGKDIIKM